MLVLRNIKAYNGRLTLVGYTASCSLEQQYTRVGWDWQPIITLIAQREKDLNWVHDYLEHQPSKANS